MKAYLAVVRANFLLLPVTLVGVGAAAAAYEGAFSLIRSLAALVGLVALHAAVNALNEYSDFRRGIDLETERTPFSGGSSTLPAGILPPSAALTIGLVAAAVGLGVGIGLLHVVGWKLVPILLLGALCVLGYTDFLARAYLGELFAGLGLGALPVVGTALVQGGEIGSTAIAAALPPFLMTFNLLLLNEFPDEVADRKGGRRNLIRLLGRQRAARLYALAGWSVPLWLVAAVPFEVLPAEALWAVGPSLLLVPPTRWAMTAPEEQVPIPALGANVAWNLATNTVLAISLAVAA